jgi:hypothetical protein
MPIPAIQIQFCKGILGMLGLVSLGYSRFRDGTNNTPPSLDEQSWPEERMPFFRPSIIFS